MTGAVVGALLGLGVVLVASGLLKPSRPPLVAALDHVPQFAPVIAPSTNRVRQLLAPVAQWIARIGGGRAALQRRLDQAGSVTSVDRYLLEQIAMVSTGVALALLVLVLRPEATSLLSSLVLIGLGGAGGALLGDYRLARAVQARRDRMSQEFPVAAQLFALLIAAGVPPASAVARIGAELGPDLGAELSRASRELNTGASFSRALRDTADRVGIPAFDRFVHGLLSAIERGSPLAEIARAQALDAQAESHRQLMTMAGRKDVAMLIPVVFLILPMVVVVVLLPGAVQLGLVGS